MSSCAPPRMNVPPLADLRQQPDHPRLSFEAPLWRRGDDDQRPLLPHRRAKIPAIPLTASFVNRLVHEFPFEGSSCLFEFAPVVAGVS